MARTPAWSLRIRSYQRSERLHRPDHSEGDTTSDYYSTLANIDPGNSHLLLGGRSPSMLSPSP